MFCGGMLHGEAYSSVQVNIDSWHTDGDMGGVWSRSTGEVTCSCGLVAKYGSHGVALEPHAMRSKETMQG